MISGSASRRFSKEKQSSGMPVGVVWIPGNERQGTGADWCFQPAEGWKPSVGMTPEEERMKKLCEPVYEWVQTMR